MAASGDDGVVPDAGLSPDGKLSLSLLRVELVIESNDALREYCAGSRLLWLFDTELRALPTSWQEVAAGEGGELRISVADQLALCGQLEAFQDEEEPESSSSDGELGGEHDALGKGKHSSANHSSVEESQASQRGGGVKWATNQLVRRPVFLSRGIAEQLTKQGEGSYLQVRLEFPNPPVDPKRKDTPPPFHNTALGRLSFESAREPGCTEYSLSWEMTVQLPDPETATAPPEEPQPPGKKKPAGGKAKEPEQAPVEVESEAAPVAPPTVQVSALARVAPALTPRPPSPRPVLRSLAELIEPRAARRMRTQTGEAMLEQQVAKIADMVTDEYLRVSEHVALTRQHRVPESPSSIEEEEDAQEHDRAVSARLFFQLNVSGAYSEIREKLKHAISKLVSEARPQASAEGDVLLSDVYARVMRVVNRSLNERVEAAKRGRESVKRRAEPADQVAAELSKTLGVLLARAEDAIAEGNLARAEELYQQRIAEMESALTSPGDHDLEPLPEPWFENATFCLERGNEFRAVAAECLRSSLAIRGSHLGSLVAYGALLLEVGSERDEQIEVFLAAAGAQEHAASQSDGERSLYLGAHGLLLALGERIAASQPPASYVVGCCIREKPIAGHRAFESELVEEHAARTIILSNAAELCLRLNLHSTASRMIDLLDESIKAVESPSQELEELLRFNLKFLRSQICSSQGEASRAVALATACTRLDGSAFGLLSLTQALDDSEESQAWMRSAEQAFASFRAPVAWWRCQIPHRQLRYVLRRLGNALLGESKFTLAQSVMALLCEDFATPALWLGIGVAILQRVDSANGPTEKPNPAATSPAKNRDGRIGQLDEAIQALAEANALDRRNAETWGFLALACVQRNSLCRSQGQTDYGRLSEIAFEQSDKLDLAAPVLLLEIGSAFLHEGKLSFARRALTRAFELDPDNTDCRTELARVLIMERDFDRADRLIQELAAEGSEMTDLEGLMKRYRVVPNQQQSL